MDNKETIQNDNDISEKILELEKENTKLKAENKKLKQENSRLISSNEIYSRFIGGGM